MQIIYKHTDEWAKYKMLFLITLHSVWHLWALLIALLTNWIVCDMHHAVDSHTHTTDKTGLC